MSAPANVLAVLDEVVADMGGDLPGTQGHELAQVRAAVAELVEAAKRVDALSIQSAAHGRLRAALAGVGGAA